MVVLSRMVLLATSLFLVCMPTLTSSVATNLQWSKQLAPLTLYASWDDDIDPPQTYKITLRDTAARRNYDVYGVTAKEFMIDAAGQAQMFWGTTPLVILANKGYSLTVKGETDLVIVSYAVGYMQDLCGPPAGLTICDVTDETSYNPYEPVQSQIPPSGCQRTQVSGKVRIYYYEPTDSGFHNGDPVFFRGYVFQYALDATFTTNVFEETCMDAIPFTMIEDGAVCSFNLFIGQIPSSGTIYDGLYFIRVAAITEVGTGPFTEAVSVLQGPEAAPPVCPAGQYENAYACIPCPVGTNTPPGASDIAQCTCIEGYTAESNGVVCTACAAGTWKNVTGNTTCIECPDDSASPEGSQHLVNCTCLPGYIEIP